MSLTYLLGNKGTGKTLTMVILGFLKHMAGADLFATMDLRYKDYTEIRDIEAFEQFTLRKKPGCCLLDEFWIQADSRRSGALENIILSAFSAQSRKSGTDCYITAQSEGRMDMRIREVLDYIIYPSIALRMGDPEEGVPMLINLERYDGQHNYLGHSTIPTFLGPISFPYIYDSWEVIPKFTPASVLKRRKLFAKWWDYAGTSAASTARRIWAGEEEHPISMGEATSIAKTIADLKDTGDEPPWLAETKEKLAIKMEMRR